MTLESSAHLIQVRNMRDFEECVNDFCDMNSNEKLTRWNENPSLLRVRLTSLGHIVWHSWALKKQQTNSLSVKTSTKIPPETTIHMALKFLVNFLLVPSTQLLQEWKHPK